MFGFKGKSAEIGKKEQNESIIDMIQEVIINAPISVEKEFSESGNPWLSCFKSIIFQCELYLGVKRVVNELGEKKYNLVMEKIKNLKQRVHDLEDQYPEKENIPPDEIKKELFEMLNIL